MKTERMPNGVTNVVRDTGALAGFARPRFKLIRGRMRLIGYEAVGPGLENIVFPSIGAATRYLARERDEVQRDNALEDQAVRED